MLAREREGRLTKENATRKGWRHLAKLHKGESFLKACLPSLTSRLRGSTPKTQAP